MTDPSHTPTQDSAARPGTSGGPFALTLGDVHLVSSWLTPRSSGTAARGAPKDVAIGGLSLVFDELGITLLKPSGAVGALLPWSSLLGVTVAGTVHTPGGASALMIEATTAERTHRFLVATAEPDELRAVVEEVVAARTKRRGRGRSWRTAALIVLTVVVAAGVALALLVTVGGVKL